VLGDRRAGGMYTPLSQRRLDSKNDLLRTVEAQPGLDLVADSQAHTRFGLPSERLPAAFVRANRALDQVIAAPFRPIPLAPPQ